MTTPSAPDARRALLTQLSGRRVVVVGGGKTGALAAALALRMGAHVTVVDDAPLEKLTEGLARGGLPASHTAQLVASGIDAAVVGAADLVVLSPGVPRAHAAVAPAIAAGVPFVNEVELAAAHLPASVRVIAITGTNGKSTTTTMAGVIAKKADEHAFVGGNLGTPYCRAALDVLDGKPAPRFAVLELSSYQLETIERLPARAAVFTNLTPDHLDRYPNAAAYYAAKARLLTQLTPDGGVSLNATDRETRAHLFPLLPGGLATCHFDVPVSSETTAGIAITAAPAALRGQGAHAAVALTLDNPRIVGHHNRQNAAAAVAGCLLAGVPTGAWQLGLDGYGGIAHRLERVGEHAGVAWFNDSKATNVDAAVTALKSFTGGVHLIAGGLGKGAPYAPLVDAARGVVRAVYTIGKDAPLIRDAFTGVVPVVECGTLDVACARAAHAAIGGDVVLLSPACASFDQFKDYANRGEVFRAQFDAIAKGSA